MTCNAKFAAYVKKNTPLAIWLKAFYGVFNRYFQYSVVFRVNRGLDSEQMKRYILIVISHPMPLGGQDALAKRWKPFKDRCSQKRRHIEFLTREGQGSEISRGRVLRSTRPHSGEIRDVAPCACGKRFGDGGRWRIRPFPSGLLSGQRELRKGWNRWIGAQEARPTRTSQASKRGVGVSQASSHPRTSNPGAPTGKADSARVRAPGAPQNNRTGAGGKKNTEVESGFVEKSAAGFSLPVPIACRYEALRKAALGEPLPPEARSGLPLFLRRGMWAWSRMLTANTVARQPARSSLPSRKDLYPQRALVRAFATMALDFTNGRTP